MANKLTKEQRELLIDFLDSIREYERESHNLIGFDERDSFEFVSMYEGEILNSFNFREQYCKCSQRSLMKPISNTGGNGRIQKPT